VHLFVWLISHQPAVLFSQNKPATSNQSTVLFSQNKPAPAISHQPNEQVGDRGDRRPNTYGSLATTLVLRTRPASLAVSGLPSPPASIAVVHPVRLAYQPPANSTFLSQQTSHQQPASSTLLSEQTSTSHQPPANRTGSLPVRVQAPEPVLP
jgi:hypothetical protein